MAEQTEAPVKTTDSGGGGMGGIGEGYAQAGASTFNTAVSWITYGQERKKLDAWRQQDLTIAERTRQDDLAQQARENHMLSEQFGFTKEQAKEQTKMAQEQFDFGKMRWGQEFGLTQRQYRDQLRFAKGQEKRAQSQEKRTQEGFDIEKRKMALENAKESLNNILSKDLQMKQLVTSRFGG